MHSFVKSSFMALTLVQWHHSARACEGACIIDTTKAFISNYSMNHIEPVFNSLSELIHSKILYDRPIGEVRALISPISHHWHETIYAQTEKAIFPDYFHGKCQRVIDGVYKHPVGCPNPDCPVVCGTPGSMVHFYDKLVSIVFKTMQKSLHTSLPTEGIAYDRLEQAVKSLASSTKRRSSLFARSNVNDSHSDESSDSDSSSPPDGERLHALNRLPMRKNAEGHWEPQSWKRSLIPLDISNSPVDLIKSERESIEEVLPEEATTLLRRSLLPIDPATLLSEGALPVDANSLLQPRALPNNLGHLRSSLLAGTSLPIALSNLLSRSLLPINPTEALESLPLKPTENDSVADVIESATGQEHSLLSRSILPTDPTQALGSLPLKPTELPVVDVLESAIGQEHLPVDASKVLTTAPLPIPALLRRDFPVDPSVLQNLPVDQVIEPTYSNEVVSKVDELKREDLTPLPSVDRLLAVRSESLSGSLRFRRVLRSSLVGDDEKTDDESSDDKGDGENDSDAEPLDDPASDDTSEKSTPEKSTPEHSSDDGADDTHDGSPVSTTDDDAIEHTPRRLHRRQQGLDLPKLTGLDHLTVPVISKRRLPRVTDEHITVILKQIIESCNGQLVDSCGAKLENCRWDKSMKPFILSFP